MIASHVRRRAAGALAGMLLVAVPLPLWARAHQARAHEARIHEGGQAKAETSQRERGLSIARDVMSTARYCTLVTLDALGQPQARIVDPLAPDAGFGVYVATNPLSRKVGEIRKDPRVTLLYFDSARPGYVTLIGHAVLVAGPEKQAHHKTEWQRFFPAEKPETYTLYRIVPSRVEVVSAKDGLAGDPSTWRPEIIDFK